MLNEDKINALLGEDFKLSPDDVIQIKNSQTEQWPTNYSQFVNQVKSTGNESWLSKVANAVWGFVAKNIIWAPVRAVGSQVATTIAWIKSLASWNQETIEWNTPFGKITSIDVWTESFAKQWTAAWLDTIATIEMFSGWLLQWAKKSILSNVKNKIWQKLAWLWLDMWFWALSGAASWAAGWYSEDREGKDALVGWVVGAWTWAAFAGIFSIASGLRKMTKWAKIKKIESLTNKSYDKTIQFYPDSELKWGMATKFDDDIKLRDALYIANKQSGWPQITWFESWKTVNKNILNNAVETMDKFAQSASDAQSFVKPTKTTWFDIDNLFTLKNKDLGAAEVALKTNLLDKLKSWTLTPTEWMSLIKMLNGMYETAWQSTQKSISNIADDVYDTITNYWKQQVYKDADFSSIADIVQTTRDSIRATTVTQKMLDNNLQPQFKKLLSAARQWNESEISSILDTIYNGGLGIKSKTRLVASILKNVAEKGNIQDSIDNIIMDAFSDINNDVAAKAYQSIIQESLSDVNKQKALSSLVDDIEVQKPSTNNSVNDELSSMYDEMTKNSMQKSKKPIQTYSQPKQDVVPNNNTYTNLPKINKDVVDYATIYQWQTVWQLNNRKVSIQRKIAELSKNKTTNKIKISEYNEELAQINELIKQKK